MRIPFKIPNVSEIDEAAGFLYLEDEFLVFDFHILDWGITKGKSSTVKAERSVIEGIRLKRGWFNDKLFIATRNVKLLNEIPGPHVSEVELRTKRKHREQVDTFIEAVWEWKLEKPTGTRATLL